MAQAPSLCPLCPGGSGPRWGVTTALSHLSLLHKRQRELGRDGGTAPCCCRQQRLHRKRLCLEGRGCRSRLSSAIAEAVHWQTPEGLAAKRQSAGECLLLQPAMEAGTQTETRDPHVLPCYQVGEGKTLVLTLSWRLGRSRAKPSSPASPPPLRQRAGQRGQARALSPRKHRDPEGHNEGQSQDAQHGWTRGPLGLVYFFVLITFLMPSTP